MNTEEKILELLEKLNSRMENLESGQAALEGRMERIGGDLKSTNLELRNLENKQAAFEGRMGHFEAALVGIQDDLTAVKLRLELDIEKRFDSVNEGIDSILEKLTPKNRVDELEADVVVLKSAIKALSQEVAELKKAQ